MNENPEHIKDTTAKLLKLWDKGLITEREFAEELIVAAAKVLEMYTPKIED